MQRTPHAMRGSPATGDQVEMSSSEARAQRRIRRAENHELLDRIRDALTPSPEVSRKPNQPPAYALEPSGTSGPIELGATPSAASGQGRETGTGVRKGLLASPREGPHRRDLRQASVPLTRDLEELGTPVPSSLMLGKHHGNGESAMPTEDTEPSSAQMHDRFLRFVQQEAAKVSQDTVGTPTASPPIERLETPLHPGVGLRWEEGESDAALQRRQAAEALGVSGTPAHGNPSGSLDTLHRSGVGPHGGMRVSGGPKSVN